MGGSKLYGCEIDPVPGHIAKHLYPDADIQVTGFEQTAFSDHFFDVMVGNVPFNSIKAVSYTHLDVYKRQIHKVYEKYIKVIGKSKDELIRERVADMRDVKNRLLRCLDGLPERNLATLDEPVIIVAHDLFPSDTATLDRSKVLAIVT